MTDQNKKRKLDSTASTGAMDMAVDKTDAITLKVFACFRIRQRVYAPSAAC